MIVTYLLDSSTLPDPLEFTQGLQGLPLERIEKIRRQKQPDARRQTFGAGLLLNYGLSRTDGHAADGQGRSGAGKLHYNAYGKPLADGAAFNLSHSGKYIILSIQAAGGRREFPPDDESREGRLFIGCDIERITEYKRKIAERFFTAAEYRSLEEAPGGRRQAELFFRCWTRKESVLKLAGTGMAMPMDLFDVAFGGQAVPDREKTLKWLGAVRERDRPECRQAAELLLNSRLFFKEYRYDGCCITVCSTWNRFLPRICVKKACIGTDVVIS